jgi:WhiB family redox-sensing transcriptional regulator
MTRSTHGPITGSRPRTEQAAQTRTVRLAAPAAEADPDWRTRAVCANTGQIDLWFPAGNTGSWLVQIDAAKTACLGCPVLENCAGLLADMQRDLAGVWAGTSEDDRMGVKRRAKKAAERARQRAKKVAA